MIETKAESKILNKQLLFLSQKLFQGGYDASERIS